LYFYIFFITFLLFVSFLLFVFFGSYSFLSAVLLFYYSHVKLYKHEINRIPNIYRVQAV